MPTRHKALKIIHVATHRGVYRGGAVQLCRMATVQHQRGHGVHVLVSERRRDSREEKIRDRSSWQPLIDAGVETRFLDYNCVAGKFRLRALLQRGGFDIAHVHRDDALMACWLATWGLKRPALIAQRGTIKPPPPQPRRAFASPRVRAAVAVSQAVGDALAEAVGPDRIHKIHVIYGGVDLTEFFPCPCNGELKRRLEIPPQSPVIGSLSAYRRAKGFRTFLRALAPVMAARPEVYAVFLGHEVADHVRPIAEKLKIADRCRFVGHQSHVADWIALMDLTVVAATGREGLSGVLRESLAMETPVISTNCAGNGEIVRDRETGLLVPMKDGPALADALGWALDHPESMKSMARAGRRWVQDHCSVQVQAEKLERLYRSVLEEEAGASE